MADELDEIVIDLIELESLAKIPRKRGDDWVFDPSELKKWVRGFAEKRELALLDELEKEKPEPKKERVSYSEDPESDAHTDGYIAGFNDALEEVSSVFNNKRKEYEK